MSIERRTIPERLSALEERVNALTETNKEISEKLDDLIALRNKGVGIFWLIAALFGTGVSGLISWLMKGHG